ncbi:MAG: hypothetical protein ACI8UP_004470, partial [Porticoccaceae bacterium]
EIVERHSPTLSEAQKRALFKDNCAAFYKLN